MAEAARERGCRTMVGFNRRFIPVFREAKRRIEEFGPVTYCVAAFHKNALGQPEPWGRARSCFAFNGADRWRRSVLQVL
jgi:predicted dehydrogenase